MLFALKGEIKTKEKKHLFHYVINIYVDEPIFILKEFKKKLLNVMKEIANTQNQCDCLITVE